MIEAVKSYIRKESRTYTERRRRQLSRGDEFKIPVIRLLGLAIHRPKTKYDLHSASHAVRLHTLDVSSWENAGQVLLEKSLSRTLYKE